MIELDLPTRGIRWSVRIDEAGGPVLAEHEPQRVLNTASVGKIFLLAEVARRFEEGALDPAEVLAPTPGDRIADSGILYLFGQQEQSAADLAVLVGAFSDNMATNMLLRRVGVPAVAALTRRLGFEKSGLHDFVRDDRGPEHPPALSTGTAAELAAACARIETGELVSPAVSARLRGWLSADADLSMTAGAFGLDPLAHGFADRGVALWNKTGTIETARIDVGCVRAGERALAYAVLANWDDPGTAAGAGAHGDPRDEVLAAMRRIGEQVRQHLQE
ncbi:serine hydrolase [Brevibacterium sp. 5221]|uniref:Serine hydrolase n=1 Tax=Brevibacterium rongguiense TaxID=2695267 RepID=A0A6N9H3Q7_9MICO|nr:MULTISPECIES: serine hydrolase [Brevibacterium]MYM18553.1 serine hydrolase [Brevibacterium rongguiense]WAL39624.1 class A beta-lactamase-related serine hydrolase [Brevibacterium sp. BRM-1]